MDCPREMLDAYIEAALWSSTDDDGEPLDRDFGPDDIHPDTLAKMREDCQAFFDECWNDDHFPIYNHREYSDEEMFGHDFWLSRNGHGAGFFDRGLGKLGDELQNRARVWGEFNLYVGDDGLIHGA